MLGKSSIRYQFFICALENMKLQDVDTSPSSDISISQAGSLLKKDRSWICMDSMWNDDFYFIWIFKITADTTALPNDATQ